MSGGRLAFELVRWAIGFLLLWRMPRLPSVTAAAPAGVVPAAVVVPARNEEDNLTRLLPTVIGAAADVVVVDDSSSDATASVAANAGARVVDAGELPPGWLGKPWACAQGAAATAAVALVFVDADVTVEDGGLARVVDAQRRAGGLVSAQPWHDARRPYEKLSMFPNLIGLMGVGAFTIAGSKLRPRGAFGPCMAIDRTTYDDIGGHAAVRAEVAEDVALARLAPSVSLYSGRGALRYRMYPHGWRSLVEGWTKNLAAGATATNPVVLLAVVAWVSGLIQAPFTAWWLWAAFVIQLRWLTRDAGRFGIVTALVYPVPLLFFVGVFFASAIRTFVAGSVTWRGRSVTTR